jgi:hypothetical protein
LFELEDRNLAKHEIVYIPHPPLSFDPQEKPAVSNKNNAISACINFGSAGKHTAVAAGSGQDACVQFGDETLQFTSERLRRVPFLTAHGSCASNSVFQRCWRCRNKLLPVL